MPSTTKRTEQYQYVQETLKRSGLKWTRPRCLISDVLFHSDRHLTVEEIFRALREEPPIAVATVYRTVRLFENLGFLAGVDLGDGMERFEWIHSARQHHHLLCTKCRSVTEVDADILNEPKETVFLDTGFQIDEREITFTGICKECKLKE
ncbi:MAG TPA: transcriptional repressor [Tissierellia bacterium]|nr:transcriptional repressor [Tissierellia bacterium]